MVIEKLKMHKSPGSDEIPAALIKIHKLVNSICNLEGVNHCTHL
jgi:hypothetical protein